MSDAPFAKLPDEAREKLERGPQPRWTDPMLATLTHEVFSDPDWVYERKLDGIRCLVFRDGDDVRLVSRNRKPMNDTYPELADDVAAEPRDAFVADGEIVAFEDGRTSFARLQDRIGVKDPDEARKSGVAVYLYLFDLLHVAGHDTTALALRDRKALLRRALSFPGHVRFTPHRNRDGEAFHRAACDKGWEGIVAKDARAPYAHDRSTAWLKMKCTYRQELVVGGYTEPGGSRRGFGALLVGHYEGDTLRYAGKVGTGYDRETLASLGARLRSLRRAAAPFADAPDERGVHFVDPVLVAEIGFTEWTRDGRLRHPRFVGLRDDKDPRDVHRETPPGA